MLKGKKIVIGITGSIAAFKHLPYRSLKKERQSESYGDHISKLLRKLFDNFNLFW